MKYLNILLIAFCLFAYGMEIQAQSAIPVTGGNATGTGGTVSYTIGQVVYTTGTGTTGSVVQGVQQPYEISIITGLVEAKDINLNCSIYPNPASDLLTLVVENYDKENLSYKLFDANGKLLESKKVNSTETTISMANLILSIYILKVLDGNKEVKTFKIIKN